MRWTEEEIEQLRILYPKMITRDIGKKLNKTNRQIYDKAQHLGLKKDQEFLMDYYRQNYKGYPRTQFRKGMTSWNKGTKGVMIGGIETQFKKGQEPHNTKPIGYRSLRDGYLVEKTGQGFKFVHVLLWESVNGPVPKGLFVVFKDKNKANITLDNLELIDRHEHMRRNNIKNLPKELREVLSIKRSITRKINQLEKNGTQQN
jgi:hypothetical protein